MLEKQEKKYFVEIYLKTIFPESLSIADITIAINVILILIA